MRHSFAGLKVLLLAVYSVFVLVIWSCGSSSVDLFSDSGSRSDSDVSDEVDSETSPDSDSRDEYDSEPSDSDEIEEDADEIEADADEIEIDADEDTPDRVGTCETCVDDESCEEGSLCVLLEVHEYMCLPECDLGAPLCPRGFECVIPADGDVDTEVCFPEVDSPCCLDADGDGYGFGEECLGADCDDENENIHPDADELCNGISDDCDAEIDEIPNDCECMDEGCADCVMGDDGFPVMTDGTECVDGECVPVVSEILDCGPYSCDIETDDCPLSCIEDSECADGAHCSSGDCRWDLDQGVLCERDRECENRRCVDNRCCDNRCAGICESCSNSDGECRANAAGTDPDAECGGFACTDYYGGFDFGDTCYRRDRVDDDNATCDGMRACTLPDDLCELQPFGETIINCDDACQEPTPGTCGFGVPGTCDNLDAVAGTHTCGLGICENTVDRCRGGRPNPCDPLPVARVESCNSLDDDCDGTPDDGHPDDLCGGHPTILESTCEVGVCGIALCVPGTFDLDGDYDNGCESDHP